MAKYNVTYACGHEGQVELFGPGKERQRKIEWMERESLCPECWKAEKAKEAEESNVGLVPLIGSEKQVAWALDIRGRYWEDTKRLAEKLAKGDMDKVTEALDNARKIVNVLDSAKWWIENRTYITHQVVVKAYQQTIAKK